MKTVFAPRVIRTPVLTAFLVLACATAHAGPEVTFYLTLPLGAGGGGHVLGLRLDHESSPPAIAKINPESPLNRRPLLDLQLGAHSALRLDLDRRLTWDINRQQWRETSRPATFSLSVPTRERPRAEAHPSEALLADP